jgi:hypothetical protein
MEVSVKQLSLALGAALACSACVPRNVVPPTTAGAQTHVDMAPTMGPEFAGTYDFDLLGEVQGDACAAFTGSADQFGYRKVLVNGQPQYFHVAVTGLTPNPNASAIEIQAEQAALFDALNKLQGADVIFVTRSRVLPKTADEVCTTVWGQVARLKKGPTKHGESPVAEAPAPPAPPPAPAPMPAPAPAPGRR